MRAAAASVTSVPALNGIKVTIAGQLSASETIVTELAPHVLAITTTLPDHATTLTSTYTGHPAIRTHAVHLELAPGHEHLHTGEHDNDSLPVTHARERCLLDHAAALQALTGALVDVDDSALRGLER